MVIGYQLPPVPDRPESSNRVSGDGRRSVAAIARRNAGQHERRSVSPARSAFRISLRRASARCSRAGDVALGGGTDRSLEGDFESEIFASTLLKSAANAATIRVVVSRDPVYLWGASPGEMLAYPEGNRQSQLGVPPPETMMDCASQSFNDWESIPWFRPKLTGRGIRPRPP